MGVRAMTWAFDQQPGGAGLKVTLLALANRADDYTGRTIVGQRRLAHETSQCERTVRSHVAALERRGYLRRQRRHRDDGTRTSDATYVALDDADPDGGDGDLGGGQGDYRQDLPDLPARFAAHEPTGEPTGVSPDGGADAPQAPSLSERHGEPSGGDSADAESPETSRDGDPKPADPNGTPPQSAQKALAAPEPPPGETAPDAPASPTDTDLAPTATDKRRFAERWRDHATHQLGLQLPNTNRLSHRFHAVFKTILDHTNDPHSATIAFITDYIEIACGEQHKLQNAERSFLARVAKEWQPLDVFNAAVTAVTSGAGTAEYANHPKPIVAYMRRILDNNE